jgi:hypothetical protein
MSTYRNPKASSRLRPLAAITPAVAVLAATAGCSLTRIVPLPRGESSSSVVGAVEVVSEGEKLSDVTVDQLYPCNDGDLFAYRVVGGPRSGQIMVSRTFALAKAGDFRVTNSYGGTLAEALHLRIDDDGVDVVSQVDAEQDVGVTFAQPLPLITMPLRAGVTRFKSPIRIWRPSSGRTMGSGEVSLEMSVNEEPIEGYDKAYAAKQMGTFKLMRQTFDIESTAWLAPGLGEVRGRRVQAGTETEVFTLVCARIGGKEVLDCGRVAKEIAQ